MAAILNSATQYQGGNLRGLMEFEDEWEDTLVCPACGHSVDLEHYGMENDEEYDALYPTRDQICDD